MPIIKEGAPVEPSPFCMCIPPLWFTVGIGTVWECGNCGRWYERIDASHPRGSAGAKWTKIRGAVR